MGSKLFVAQVVNGNFKIVSEWTDNEQGAVVSFHSTCANLWNSADVLNATVKILNESLDLFQGKVEVITHQPEPEPEG